VSGARWIVLGCTVVALLAGCGGHAPGKVHARVLGRGADRVWVFEPPGGHPRNAVVFVHGQGDELEDTPYYHRPWLRHLAQRGSLVLYPRYELSPGSPTALSHLLRGLRRIERTLHLRQLPVLAIGYSRGGWLALAYASRASEAGIVPDAVLSIFPESPERPFPDLGQIRAGTRIEVLAGDHDEVVSGIGANQILALLRLVHYPRKLLDAELVHSHGDFVAAHESVLDDTPGARAAYWARADRLLDELR
jgi:pimeloyl-ACP methyl ester carboxylesterase